MPRLQEGPPPTAPPLPSGGRAARDSGDPSGLFEGACAAHRGAQARAGKANEEGCRVRKRGGVGPRGLAPGPPAS